VHSASNYPNGLAAAIAGKTKGARSIYEVRGLWHLSRATRRPFLDGSQRFKYEELMEVEAMNASDCVVALSEALADRMLSWGVDAEKITVVPNAVDTDRFKPLEPDESLRRELELGDSLVVGFVGSLQEYEGLDLLVEAASRLSAQGVKITVLIVGDGRSLGKLAASVRAHRVGEQVKLLGRVPFEEVSRYYSIFDVCAFPRKDYEVCKLIPPLKILEAMAMAKPVIVSDLAPLLEMVTPGKTGLAFRVGNAASLAEALASLAEDSEARKEIGRQGRNWVSENRSWRRIAKLYLPLYGI
jgi:glycosyltransferase involved in cell wall biosynthesis